MFCTPAFQQVTVEGIKLLAAFAVNSAPQAPDNSEKEEALKPQCHLWAGH